MARSDAEASAIASRSCWRGERYEDGVDEKTDWFEGVADDDGKRGGKIGLEEGEQEEEEEEDDEDGDEEGNVELRGETAFAIR